MIGKVHDVPTARGPAWLHSPRFVIRNPSPNHRHASASEITSVTQELVAAELRMRQKRLGTRAERPEDFRIIRDLVHLLNNQTTAETLLASVKALTPPKHNPSLRFTRAPGNTR